MINEYASPKVPVAVTRPISDVGAWSPTLKFSAANGVQSMNEIFPLDQAAQAYDRMMSGKARFRVVLDVTAAS